MITDSNLEQRSDWEMKVGPDIGGPKPFIQPDFYSVTVHEDATQYYIRGKPYTDWLAALHRPFLPNAGHLSLAFELMTDANAFLKAQAIEFDTRVSFAGMDYNHSFQINYERNGVLQISDQVNVLADGKVTGGNWVDTGHLYGKLEPRSWYPVRLHYGFDIAAKTYRTERIDIGDEWFEISLPTLKAAKLGWADGAHCQVQQDLNAAGGFYSIYTRNMHYYWA